MPFKEYSQRYRGTFFDAEVDNQPKFPLVFVEEVQVPGNNYSENFAVQWRGIKKKSNGDAESTSVYITPVADIKILRAFPEVGVIKYKQAPYAISRTATKQYYRACNGASVCWYPLMTNAIEYETHHFNNVFWKDFSRGDGEKLAYKLLLESFYPNYSRLKDGISSILQSRSFCEVLSKDFYLFPSIWDSNRLVIWTSGSVPIAYIDPDIPDRVTFIKGTVLTQEFIDLLTRTGQLNDCHIGYEN